MHEVLRTLQEAGVQIRRVEVVLSDQSGKDLAKEQFQQQDAWTQQQTSQHQAGNPRGSGLTEWQTPAQAAQSSPGPQDADPQDFTATGRINMLM